MQVRIIYGDEVDIYFSNLFTWPYSSIPQKADRLNFQTKDKNNPGEILEWCGSVVNVEWGNKYVQIEIDRRPTNNKW